MLCNQAPVQAECRRKVTPRHALGQRTIPRRVALSCCVPRASFLSTRNPFFGSIMALPILQSRLPGSSADPGAAVSRAELMSPAASGRRPRSTAAWQSQSGVGPRVGRPIGCLRRRFPGLSPADACGGRRLFRRPCRRAVRAVTLLNPPSPQRRPELLWRRTCFPSMGNAEGCDVIATWSPHCTGQPPCARLGITVIPALAGFGYRQLAGGGRTAETSRLSPISGCLRWTDPHRTCCCCRNGNPVRTAGVLAVGDLGAGWGLRRA